jgi:Leucine-rich repeat (LRR) protein
VKSKRGEKRGKMLCLDLKWLIGSGYLEREIQVIIKMVKKWERVEIWEVRGLKHELTDEEIKKLVNLRELNLWNNEKITDLGIKNLVNLRKLDLAWNEKITDKGIKNLVNLKVLFLYENKKITDEKPPITVVQGF